MEKRYGGEKHIHVIIIFFIAYFMVFGSPYAAFSQDNDSEFFYYSDGQIISLHLSKDYICVMFEPDSEYDVSKAYPPFFISNQKSELAQHHLVLFYLKKGFSPDEVKNLMNELSEDVNIKMVAPTFDALGASMIVTDKFIAQFSLNISERDITYLNERYATEIVKKVTWAENCYLLRVLKGNALEMANTYHELDEVIYAHPDFVRVMKLMPQSMSSPMNETNNLIIIGPNGDILPSDTLIEKNTNMNQYRSVGPASMKLDEPLQSNQTGPLAPVSQTTIKAEGFEGAFPNSWALSGSPTWGDRFYRSYSGSWSGYCVGSSVTPPGPYPNNVDSWMVYGPFNLSDAQDACVNLQAWIDTELYFDGFSVYASINGTDFYGTRWTGNWAGASGGQGWMNISFDLKHVYNLGNICGESEVWIGLVFDSDYSLNDEGVYVDDITIRKITGGYQSITSDTYDHLQWSLNNNGQACCCNCTEKDINSVDAWSKSHGSSSITIAIIDEGVDLAHPDLTSKLVAGYDATDGGGSGGPSGDDAHGTNCAGIAAAATNNSQGVAGIARLAKIMPIRIAYSDSGGNWVTNDSWIASGMTWAVSHGADVLSNSWGGGSASTTVTNAINNAKNNGRGGKGAVVIFATGNDNGPVHYPATLSQVLAVGALSPCDERKSPASCDGEYWWGSNYGAQLDISAPGVHMYSTDIVGASGYDSGDYFYNFNGTSSATPVVSGVAALVLGYCPCLKASIVESRLKYTATDLLTPGWDPSTGYGRINAYNALANGCNCNGGGALVPIYKLLLLD